ncbi:MULTISPECIES: glycosyltransferase family 1 protein [Cyanophyceae]|uniref:glycosyltransferase family 4 protein n=1 Tax=Cyanophyceae TaxID=3028117 RepID=UPI001687287A|nr:MULTISPECIES: glycosyltransferase family 1 protein [Cyanophyceae]MBD1918198.1 glycosyltransferase family 4 protein [Phormidium sp. FACHB-77]MBD2030230.1 glycosyltransferase family 4 protein [Phormidium sp. FACHB-322]MBD2051398.1 glycosyltransferase family 4 protein [Leptolyngbya sp. FACHB-60]
MRIAIVRRALGASFSMDVYADGLVGGLRQVRPHWDVVEIIPSFLEYQGSALSRVGKYYRRYGQFPRQVRRHTDVDLFHIVDHSDGHLCYTLGRAQRPVVVTCHDLINYIQPENISTQTRAPLVSTWIWRYAVQGIALADHIIAVSDHTAKDVMATFAVEPTRVTTAHNGVDPAFRPLPPAAVAAARSRYQLAPDTLCLLNVGSNHPRKNLVAVLKALAVLHQQGLPVHLLKAGADFTADQKTYLQQQNLTDCVTYVGKPEQAELVKLYNAADILVAPSLYEGFGITPAEAMACGTPVVVANATALPEVVGSAGLLVPPEDIGAIAAAIRQLHEQPDTYQHLVKAGCDRAQRFTWAAHAEHAALLYENLVKPH